MNLSTVPTYFIYRGWNALQVTFAARVYMSVVPDAELLTTSGALDQLIDWYCERYPNEEPLTSTVGIEPDIVHWAMNVWATAAIRAAKYYITDPKTIRTKGSRGESGAKDPSWDI